MLESLNPQQHEAVVSIDGPLLLVAGAGSGKTRVLTTRIAHLIRDHDVAPWNILAFTFTNKAAREMRERVQRLVPAGESCWIGTFHATGVRILRREAHRIGFPNQFSIYDADDSRSVISEILKARRADSKLFTPRGVASEISRFKNASVSPEAARAAAASGRDETLADIFLDYQKTLRKNAAMDFDDLIAKTVELFESEREVQEFYGARFRYVLVDEFQDTNPLQLILIKALSAVHGNLFAVGDDDQAIYSWRGATVENMLHFEDYFRGARLLRLEQNYRSTSLILRAANGVIEHNARRKGKTLWTDRQGGDPIELWWAEDAEHEASLIRDRIGGLLSEHDLRRRDVAILYRTNAQSRALEDALRREGIPYQIVGGTRFFERREVRDLMAYCKLIVNPADAVSLLRILNVPRRGIGKTSVERFLAEAAQRDIPALELMRDSAALAAACGAGGKKLLEFGRLISDLRKFAAGHDAAAVLRQVLSATQYDEWLQKDDPTTATERRENVAELLNAAHAFVNESDEGKLADFVESVALLADVDQLEDQSDVVTLMTMHNAKGLEFPAVFIAGCEEGLLPHASSMDELGGVEEERRLFYVGITRAERQLFLCTAASRQRFGSQEPMLPSRFLRELPSDCVEERGEPPLRAASSGPLFAPSTRLRESRPSRPLSTRADPGFGQFGVETFRRSRVGREKRGSFTPSEFSQEEVYYRVGCHVRHELLGDGTIEAVEGSGDLLRLTISFAEAGRKRILARYAHLTRLDEIG